MINGGVLRKSPGWGQDLKALRGFEVPRGEEWVAGSTRVRTAGQRHWKGGKRAHAEEPVRGGRGAEGDATGSGCQPPRREEG